MVAISAFIERTLGPLSHLRSVGGGDTHASFQAHLLDGRTVFLKHSPIAHPFEAEALGLQAMRASGTSLWVPEPLAWDAHHLVLPWLEPGPPAPDHLLGEGLAQLHHATAEAFGFSVTGSCGATWQANPWTTDWPTFFLAHRMHPLVSAMQWDAAANDAFDQLARQLPERLQTDEAPALVHGDLWSGNCLETTHGHTLIDPAAHYAHREFELGMMTLFGGFRPRVYEAYRASWPLPSGWHDRVAIYRLYHLMNHAALFGGAYRRQARTALLDLAG